MQLAQLISLIDLTNLNEHSSPEDIAKLCHKATTTLANVAGVCVYPNHIPLIAKLLRNTDIKLISVANFPSGQEKITQTLNQIDHAVSEGANEIDVVFPYSLYLDGSVKEALHYIRTCRKKCDSILLKVILEISAFPQLEDIYQLSMLLIEEGVDFLKTSTGRSQHGATVDGASQMLLAIKNSDSDVGFKASGGIKTIDEATAYCTLAQNFMGPDWVNSDHLRIGATILLDAILAASEQQECD